MKVREPIKTTSKEKKKKIIEAGLKAFSETGYYNTTTAEIAKIAGVSTGIVYSYFKDKKDIFLHSIRLYFDNMFDPIKNLLNESDGEDLKVVLKKLIDISIKAHQNNFTAHEEMLAMSHLDEDVHNLFMEVETNINSAVIEFLSNKINTQNIQERVHICYNLIESLCHECVYHKHNTISSDKILSETIDCIMFLLSKNWTWKFLLKKNKK